MTSDASSTPVRSYRGRSLEDRRADRRERFQAAGLELFGTLGFARVTISALCAEAGLSRRQFYEEYSGSEELLTEIYSGIQSAALGKVSEAIAASDPTDLHSVARNSMRAYLDAVAVDPRIVRCAFIEIGGISEAMEHHRVTSRDEWAQYMGAMIAALPSTTSKPIDYSATAFIGSMTAVVHRWATADPRPDRETIVALLADLLVRIAVDSD
ncbi:TetR family transcriptional regulator [Gordonia spumicola]|uniref:TetR family transcriptional regulator n=1 Tax=Gordonia spumicola TaxID=589161 RepID=A0A7I9V5V3_9ACTN|nr:TetR/AcrR family transcriptional regulator [Gordonia spumicola]GEE00450.1 TetR family transcriptional regulator [Gordonia spumicola]